MQEVLEPQPKPQVAPSVVRKFSNPTSGKKNLILGVVSVLVVLAGIGTGYLFSGVKGGGKLIKSGDSIKVTENEAGIADESKFSTTTDGILTEGGIGGEGMYHLVRGSGPSQYAYLTSSVIDMGPFVGKKVQIWGETVSGKKAGWLIDVGKIKVVD